MEHLVYIGQLAYFLTFLSFALRNVNWLRATAICSSAAAIFYSAQVSREPLWIPILWNALFILTNAAQLLLTRWRARSVALDPLENFLGKTVLLNFPPAEVKSLTAIASEGNVAAGKHLIQAGMELRHLFCIVQGRVDVITNGVKHAELTPGYFVGEMSLLTKSKARADVVATTDLKLLVWPHEAIEKWVDSDAARLSLLQQALGTQVVDQLLKQNDALMNEVQERIAG